MKQDRQIKSLLKIISEGIYEKQHILAMSLLCAVAGESIFLLGLLTLGIAHASMALLSLNRSLCCLMYAGPALGIDVLVGYKLKKGDCP